MAIQPRSSSVTLNIRLLKSDINIGDAFRDTAEPDEVPTETPPGSRLFIDTSRGRPSWMPLLAELTTHAPDFWTQSSSAVLAVPVEARDGTQRVFLLCFGGGHFLVDPDKIERNFGLKVVLNTVSRRNLRSLDSATLDATVFQRRTQSSRNADLSGFGIDVQRDLLRVAAGAPTNRQFAKFVAGRDSLTITCAVAQNELPAKLAECLSAFYANDYRQDYEWIDNVQIVTEVDEIALLDEELNEEIARLRAGEPSDLHMCPPEIVDYIQGQNLAYYGRGFSREKVWYSQLNILEYVAELNAINFNAGIETIKNDHFVRMHEDEETRSKPKWKIYDCFVYESIIDERIHVLYAGTWYRISQAYKDRIETFFRSLLRPALLDRTTAVNERALLVELNQRDDLLLMDQTKVNPRDVNNGNIEVCDFFSKNRQFIHLKDGGSSSSISHLWSQAVTSCDALMSDARFRNGVRRQARLRQAALPVKEGFENLLPPGRQGRVDTSAYTVVYGILRDRYQLSRRLDIPFFSKVSLQAPAALLAKFGYSVEVHLIEKVAAVAQVAVDEDC
ncbi:DUF6119 family protein [Brucella pituitosa]|uniref:TIGR04141 family sporadically distributed protein n=1 Tax=Brucella pituitosa TaxID=571256 RepID=A0ABS3K4Z6_9HYPH|nr:DUF6119 family protein [Brucella pituitosa]MBO1041984.1 TIGR04141 family sporadically distributed protein [Brucella pituitosa]